MATHGCSCTALSMIALIVLNAVLVLFFVNTAGQQTQSKIVRATALSALRRATGNTRSSAASVQRFEALPAAASAAAPAIVRRLEAPLQPSAAREISAASRTSLAAEPSRSPNCTGTAAVELWGDLIESGIENKQPSAEACCRSCREFEPSLDTASGRQCNTWVWHPQRQECWLKHQPAEKLTEAAARLERSPSANVAWTSGLWLGRKACADCVPPSTYTGCISKELCNTTRSCGSPAIDGYAHVDSYCFERSPTALLYAKLLSSGEELLGHHELTADYDGCDAFLVESGHETLAHGAVLGGLVQADPGFARSMPQFPPSRPGGMLLLLCPGWACAGASGTPSRAGRSVSRRAVSIGQWRTAGPSRGCRVTSGRGALSPSASSLSASHQTATLLAPPSVALCTAQTCVRIAQRQLHPAGPAATQSQFPFRLPSP